MHGVEIMGLYRPRPKPTGRKPSPPETRRRIAVKVWLTEAEYEAVKHLEMSSVGRAALLAAAGK